MSLPKIVLFYVFTPLADPEAVKLWQLNLAQRTGVKGRIIVSEQGINATVGGDIRDVKAYVTASRSTPRSSTRTSSGPTARGTTSRGSA